MRQGLLLQSLPELDFFFGLDLRPTYRADVVVFQPLLDALSVEEVVPVVRQRRDAVHAVVELLHADAALVDAGAVQLGAELSVDEGVDQAAGEVVVARLDGLVEAGCATV